VGDEPKDGVRVVPFGGGLVRCEVVYLSLGEKGAGGRGDKVPGEGVEVHGAMVWSYNRPILMVNVIRKEHLLAMHTFIVLAEGAARTLTDKGVDPFVSWLRMIFGRIWTEEEIVCLKINCQCTAVGLCAVPEEYEPHPPVCL
jgi:hypothetical protein